MNLAAQRLAIVHGGIILAAVLLKVFGDSIVDTLWKNTPLGEEHPGAPGQSRSELIRGRTDLLAADRRVGRPGDAPSKEDLDRQQRNLMFTAVCFAADILGLYALCVTTAIASLAEDNTFGYIWVVVSVLVVILVRGWFETDCLDYYRGRLFSKSSAHLCLVVALNALPLIRLIYVQCSRSLPECAVARTCGQCMTVRHDSFRACVWCGSSPTGRCISVEDHAPGDASAFCAPPNVIVGSESCPVSSTDTQSPESR